MKLLNETATNYTQEDETESNTNHLSLEVHMEKLNGEWIESSHMIVIRSKSEA